MKKKYFWSIILTFLVVMSATNNLSVNSLSEKHDKKLDYHSIQPLQTDELRPLLMDVKNNGELIRERNDTLGNGAIFQADLYKNVSITYAIVNGNNETDLKLYADVPGNFSLSRIGVLENESLSFKYLNTTYIANYTVPYTSTFFENATVSYYGVEINVTTDFIPFYAAIVNGLSEDEGDYPQNLITVHQIWETQSQDEFYIQLERVNITLSAKNTTDTDVYGIKYKKVSDISWLELNFTLNYTNSNITSELDLGDFEIDNTIEWISISFLNDTVLNETRKIEGIEHKFVDIGDGTPYLDANVTSQSPQAVFYNNTIYSQTPKINFSFSATVTKGNISEIRFQTQNINTTIDLPANASLIENGLNTTHTYTTNGTFEAIIIVTTDKNLEINKTFSIVIDKVLPIIASFSTQDEIYDYTSRDGIISFNFEFSDDISNVRYAILDFGDDMSVEVTNSTNYTHTYLDLGRSFFIITLTIIDWAGNTVERTITIVVRADVPSNISPPRTELILLIIGVILIITSPFYGSKLIAIFDRFRR